MKIYLSGPISGDHEAEEKFYAMQNVVNETTIHMAVNPFDVSDHLPDGSSWEDYMRSDIKGLMDCDAILMLPGWERSKGAVIECDLSVNLGFPVFYKLDELLEYDRLNGIAL